MSSVTALTDVRWKRAERLLSEGYGCIERKDWEGALAVAERLLGLRHSGAFEIEALVHAGKGDVERAVAVLETGVERAPTVWINWQLLGNYRSDLGRFDDAATAYARALECPNVWGPSVRLNQAILADRKGEHATALALAAEVSDPRLIVPATRIRVGALAALGEGTEAERLGLEVLDGDGDESERAEIAAIIARVRLERGERTATVRAFAVEHWPLDPANERLLAVIRDADGEVSANASYHRLKVEGRVTAASGASLDIRGYFAFFHVVAVDAEECLAFVRRLDTLEPQCALSVVEIDVVEPRPNEPKGVYWASPRIYYQED